MTPNFLHGVTVAKKQLVDGGYKYDLICNFDGDFDEVVTELSQYSDIYSVSRNIYADDYFKGELGLKFNKDEIFVPLGGTADQFYTVKQEIMPELLTPYAVEIAVDPQKLDLSALSEEQLSALDITDMFYPEETGFEFYQNREYKVARYDNTVIKGGKSESGKYFLYVGLKNEIYNQEMLKKYIKDGKFDFPAYIDRLVKNNGVKAAEILYDDRKLGNDFITEYWEVSDENIVSMTLSGGKPSVEGRDDLFYEQTATLKGLKVGDTSGTVVRDIIHRFGIHVYLPMDVNVDGRVSVTDALTVLQNLVGKIEIEPETVPYYAADADGDGRISVTDALVVLKSTVEPQAV